MMAIIISCTSVARDAFEIGHVRRLAQMGRPFLTFPDGAPLRLLLQRKAGQLGPWVLAGLALGALASIPGLLVADVQGSALVQLFAVAVLGGGLTLCAYFGGLYPSTPWVQTLRRTAPGELVKYWWWPGMAFASTYYLVAMGLLLFVMRQPAITSGSAAVMGAIVTGIMALYGYYLGDRRHVENEQAPQLSSGMLRCPFVMGILGKTIGSTGTTGELALGKTGVKGERYGSGIHNKQFPASCGTVHCIRFTHPGLSRKWPR
jgi:integral membrane sensor domain MASE1